MRHGGSRRLTEAAEGLPVSLWKIEKEGCDQGETTNKEVFLDSVLELSRVFPVNYTVVRRWLHGGRWWCLVVRVRAEIDVCVGVVKNLKP